MKIFKQYSNLALISILFMLTAFTAGCGGSNGTTATDPIPTTAVAELITTTPADGAIGVLRNRSITAQTDTKLDLNTVTDATFTLVDINRSQDVNGTVSYEGTTMLFNPVDDNLSTNTTYNATITTGVKDINGIALLDADLVWSFTTGTKQDTTPPTVTSTYPADDNTTTDVPIDRSITAIFSEPLDPSSTMNAAFTLATGGTNVSGTVSHNGNTIVFTPSANLKIGADYTATITTVITDLAGNHLVANKVWSFVSGTAVATLLAPVNLGKAGNFAILSKAGVSATGTTHITGDIGVSPIDKTAITGFGLIMDSTNTFATSSLVTGKLYAADMTPPTPTYLTTAVSNMETAYTDAAGRTVPAPSVLAANITGMIIAPGIHKTTGTGVSIDASGVTLSGGTTDVWIFQIAEDLTVADGASVTLAGGALAKNIFWQVAGGVTLGTTADFKGIVLGKTNIAVNTGATVKGRLLSQTAVTLDANAVTQP